MQQQQNNTPKVGIETIVACKRFAMRTKATRKYLQKDTSQ